MTSINDATLCLDLDNKGWEIDSFIMSVSEEPNGPLTPVDMCSFMADNDHLDHSLQQNIMRDKKLYFSSAFRPSRKSVDEHGISISEPTNLKAYLNEESCHENGYSVRCKDWKCSNQYPHILRMKWICACFGRVSTGRHGSKTNCTGAAPTKKGLIANMVSMSIMTKRLSCSLLGRTQVETLNTLATLECR